MVCTPARDGDGTFSLCLDHFMRLNYSGLSGDSGFTHLLATSPRVRAARSWPTGKAISLSHRRDGQRRCTHGLDPVIIVDATNNPDK